MLHGVVGKEAHLQQLAQLGSVVGSIDNGGARLLVILGLRAKLAAIELHEVCTVESHVRKG